MLHAQHTKVKSTLDFVRVTVEILILGGVYGVDVRSALKMRATPFPCPNATLIWLRNLPSERHHVKINQARRAFIQALRIFTAKQKSSAAETEPRRTALSSFYPQRENAPTSWHSSQTPSV